MKRALIPDGYVLVGDEAFTPEEWARIPHGTISGYVHHACRCHRCRRARADYYYEREHRDTR